MPEEMRERVETTPCHEDEIPGRTFWDYISTFWNYLDDKSRDLFEFFWDGLTKSGNDLTKKAQRFYDITAPENAQTCIFEDYYDILIGPLHSKPINIDPTIKIPNHIIKAIKERLIEPTYVNENPVFNDMIEIGAVDYYKIRNIGIDNYVVVQVKKEDIADKYFKLSRLLSSEEPQNRPASAEINETFHYYTSDTVGRIRFTADDYTEDVSNYNILIHKDDGSATAITWEADGLHVSVDTGDAYDIDDIVALINVTAPNKWATARNISPKNKTDIPFMFDDFPTVAIFPNDAIPFETLANYRLNEFSNGRYYPRNGDVWLWFEGYSLLDGAVGDLGLGEWIESKSKYKYIVEIEGDLSYINGEAFNIYFTTGKVYDVLTHILDLPLLQNFIDTALGAPFIKNIDYRFYNHTVEFFEKIFEIGSAEPDTYMYCPKALIIEHSLFEMYGTMVNIADWTKFNYDGISGKAAINALLKSLQEASNRQDYQRALNIYFGLPVVPEKSEVLGLYESYEYKVASVLGNDITIDLPDDKDLHPFVQAEGIFMVEGKKSVVIDSIIDRTTGSLTLLDASKIAVGDSLYIKLRNRFAIKSFHAEELATDTPGYIDVFIPEGDEIINHIIDIFQIVSDGEQYPEILVFGTNNLTHNYDGVYHVTNAEVQGSYVRLTAYEREGVDTTIYNDYIGVTTEDVEAGFVHLSWPTHKFLYLLTESKEYYKAYLDAPIDTIHDTDDILLKYDIIARNVSALDNDNFPGWNEFDHFRRFNKINIQSDIIELTSILPGAKFGEYFPQSYREVPEI